MIRHEPSDPIGGAGVVPTIHHHELSADQEMLQTSAPGSPLHTLLHGFLCNRREPRAKLLGGPNRQRDILDLVEPHQRRREIVMIAGRGQMESQPAAIGHDVGSVDLIAQDMKGDAFLLAAAPDHLQDLVFKRRGERDRS